MTGSELFLLLLAILFSVAGQVSLKLGALKLGAVTFQNVIERIISIVTVPELLIGLCLYGLGGVAYILVLTRVKLSIAGPSSSLIYAFTVLCGYLFFNEPLTAWRLLGVVLIGFGVVFVGFSK